MAGSQCGVYVIRNTVNGLCYVGSTNNRKVRWAYHRWELRNGRHPNTHLQRAWDKYSEAAFEFLWIRDVPENLLLEEEQKWIDANPDGYNLARDATAFAKGIQWSAERRAAASAACTGRRHSAETRKRIGDVQRGKPKSPRTAEHCRKLSEAMKGKRNGLGSKRTPEAVEKLRRSAMGNQNFLGKKHTEETKRKIGAANRGRTLSPERRREISEGQIGRKQSAETRAKRSAALLAYNARKRAEVECR